MSIYRQRSLNEPSPIVNHSEILVVVAVGGLAASHCARIVHRDIKPEAAHHLRKGLFQKMGPPQSRKS
jgi:serine/threonine protein kinase